MVFPVREFDQRAELGAVDLLQRPAASIRAWPRSSNSWYYLAGAGGQNHCRHPLILRRPQSATNALSVLILGVFSPLAFGAAHQQAASFRGRCARIRSLAARERRRESVKPTDTSRLGKITGWASRVKAAEDRDEPHGKIGRERANSHRLVQDKAESGASRPLRGGGGGGGGGGVRPCYHHPPSLPRPRCGRILIFRSRYGGTNERAAPVPTAPGTERTTAPEAQRRCRAFSRRLR